MERPAAPGELRRFVQKFGVANLIDRTSRRFAELGVAHATLPEQRWIDKLVEEPLLLRLPLVRHGNALTVGPAEQDWNDWVTK